MALFRSSRSTRMRSETRPTMRLPITLTSKDNNSSANATTNSESRWKGWLASVNSLAMTLGMVDPARIIPCGIVNTLLPISMVTAIVSPNARPNPGSQRRHPRRDRGNTARRIISHLVAPNASAASFSAAGAVSKTPRQIAAIGNTMIARTTPATNTEYPKNGPWNNQPITGMPDTDVNPRPIGPSAGISANTPQKP